MGEKSASGEKKIWLSKGMFTAYPLCQYMHIQILAYFWLKKLLPLNYFRYVFLGYVSG